jgi:hypothetical protein
LFLVGSFFSQLNIARLIHLKVNGAAWALASGEIKGHVSTST